MNVAKRLSKALRGKRRWVGAVSSPKFATRTEVEESLATLSTALGEVRLRLYDCFLHDQRASDCVVTELTEDLPAEGGLVVVQVPLEAYSDLRAMLEGDKALKNHGFQSLTASGKIRLVRQRLGLANPNRHKGQRSPP